MKIEYIGKDVPKIVDEGFTLLDADYISVHQADHGKVQYLKTTKPIEKGYIIRRESMLK
jgi:putative protease